MAYDASIRNVSKPLGTLSLFDNKKLSFQVSSLVKMGASVEESTSAGVQLVLPVIIVRLGDS